MKVETLRYLAICLVFGSMSPAWTLPLTEQERAYRDGMAAALTTDIGTTETTTTRLCRFSQVARKQPGYIRGFLLTKGTEKFGADFEPVLIDSLKDEDATIRKDAANTLGELGSKASIEPLLKVAMHDPTTAEGRGCIVVTGHARVEAMRALVHIAKRNPEVHGRVVSGLILTAGVGRELNEARNAALYVLTNKRIYGASTTPAAIAHMH